MQPYARECPFVFGGLLSLLALSEDMIRDERQQRYVACALDRPSQHTLVLCTSTCLAPGPDLAPVGNELLQELNLLVGDAFAFVSRAPGRAAGGPPAPPAIPPIAR